METTIKNKASSSFNTNTSISSASNATQQADCLKGNNTFLARLSRPNSINTTTSSSSTTTSINTMNQHASHPLDANSDNASQESRIDEAIDIIDSEETSNNKRPKRQSLQRKGSSISERSAKELLHDNCNRLTVLVQRSSIEMTRNGFLSSDDESDLED
ncbi:unnamed protein product [Cylindrotheca closterium]|uniref:Uncharacterized protein n=1 Tax=Cylindrotheca closterium TaxID=2856 RepID=A0AAD2GBN6_9STRA|nr:unnamed protein product [Cylindrotheca closterium]